MKTIKIGNQEFNISDAHSKSKNLTTANSYVILSFEVGENTKQIYMAPRMYAIKKDDKADDKAEDKVDDMEEFYAANGIGLNVNLVKITHGTFEDSPANTMPLFLDAAEMIKTGFDHNKEKILVNCHHGCSRTAAVVALYLMIYLHLSAKDAIHIVTEVLMERGLPGGIDRQSGCHGTYGQWLRDYKPEAPVNPTIEVSRKRAYTTRSTSSDTYKENVPVNPTAEVSKKRVYATRSTNSDTFFAETKEAKLISRDPLTEVIPKPSN